MEYIAHTENVLGKTHKLSEHLSEVGKRARAFMYSANPKLAESAEWAGLLHDIGKYRTEFQEYIRGIREKSAETHHAVYGQASFLESEC
jgi:CRISPR-associated endonuclease/helicase Cas3